MNLVNGLGLCVIGVSNPRETTYFIFLINLYSLIARLAFLLFSRLVVCYISSTVFFSMSLFFCVWCKQIFVLLPVCVSFTQQ